MLRKLLITMTAFLIVVSGALCNGKSVSANEQRKPGDIRTIYVTTDGTTITKEKKVPAQITVVDKEGGDLYEDNVIYDTIESDGTIKVRGNSTAVADKKPFNISFSKAKDVFGMGKAKKWSLLANAFDKSLIRNRLAMEFATSLGLKYTSKSTYVDLYINDVYYGNYLLIESVEVGENRVDINSEGSNDVLLEKEYDRTEEGQTYLRTIRYGIRFNVGEPEGLAENTEQYKQTLTVLNRFETALENGDFEEVSKFVDLKSFANFYIVNELIMITGVTFLILQLKKLKIIKTVTVIIAVILSIINLSFMINNGMNIKTILSFSNDFSNELVLKQNRENGETRLYKYAKLILFAKPYERFEYSVIGDIKHQWLTNDICNITYTDEDDNLRNYVATYGSRKGTDSYYYVFHALLGRWQTQADSVGNTKLTVDEKGIKVTRDDTAEQFEFSDCKQYGVTALVLYKEDIPKYVIALNDDCEIDDDTTYIKNGGTITFCDISMKKTIKETLYCTVYKDENLNNYSGITVEANNFKIDNGILYFSYDGENIIEVPGDFSNDKSAYNDHNYIISEEKTVFFYTGNGRKYLVYSDDKGNTWNTVNLATNGDIQSI